MDRRSIELNTEMGLVIESPRLAGQVDKTLDEGIPETAYEVRLGEQGKLHWLERTAGETRRQDQEPGTTAWERRGVQFLSFLPIDWLLKKIPFIACVTARRFAIVRLRFGVRRKFQRNQMVKLIRFAEILRRSGRGG